MNKKYKKALFIFRRDLRLNDNTGLIKALQEAAQVIPCFIFDPCQLEKNDYRSDNAIQFMLESLDSLDEQIKAHDSKLYRFVGKPEVIIESLIQDYAIEAVYVNHDYTSFSKKRDFLIEKICSKNNVPLNGSHDLLLNPPGAITKKNGKPYTIFTPFFRQAIKKPVATPDARKAYHFFVGTIAQTIKDRPKGLAWKASAQYFLSGGRSEGLLLVRNLKNYKLYEKTRDIPSRYTTNLSAHLKFGTISIREVYYTLIKNFGPIHPLIRQLYWRDFYAMIAWWFPHVFGLSFKRKYDTIKWSKDKKTFKRWCEGKTGFPIVDAGMRELNETGFMHNRIRMIAASFLVKDLGIDWRLGEKYFASKLVDYDPAINNGNWQWVASTGCDAQPYVRVFNPWLQQKKIDLDALYIKRWIPELENLSAKEIHALWKKPIDKYIVSMVNHQQASAVIRNWFKNLKPLMQTIA
jgi:deoxyribodipyrimidine photo-lyase